MTESKKKSEIKVTVSFPPAQGGPYKDDVAPETTVGEVRKAAMDQFELAEDPQFEYYLTHEGARQADTTDVRSLADKAQALKFTLIKEIVQG